jgi:Integrase zinc binding domain
MLPKSYVHAERSPTLVKLSGPFGTKVSAQLTLVSGHIINPKSPNERHTSVLLNCAVTEHLVNDVALLSFNDYQTIRCGLNELLPEVQLLTHANVRYSDPGIGSASAQNSSRLENIVVNNVDLNAVNRGKLIKTTKDLSHIPLGADVERLKTVNDFRAVQLIDESFKPLWELSKVPGSGFVKDANNHLLFREKVIGRFKILQLVLPVDKRLEVIGVAHDSLWSLHFGIVKTTQRIQAHFYWPYMKEDVETYVKSCQPCQKHMGITKAARIPISPVVRAERSFESMYCDLIGPLDLESVRKHKYILSLVDSCTRWVESVPLKTVTAKETCDALLSIFTRTEIPRVLITDIATNFVSGLSEELNHRLGIEIRHSTDYHPERNSLVERWKKTLKYMLHHLVLANKPREWDLHLPYLLWEYREYPTPQEV